MKSLKKLIASLSLLVVSTVCNAIEAPNEPMPLSDFAKLAATAMSTNIVISPGLSEDVVHVYGANKYSIENIFNAVLASNGLQVRRVDGVHVLERKSVISAKYEMRMFSLESPSPSMSKELDASFSYLEKTTGYPCYFTQQGDYSILANCPKDSFPVVNNYFLYITKPVKSVSVRAHVIETTNTDFYSVGFKYGLTTNNGGISYSINDSALGSAIEKLDMLFSYDNFASLISVLESDASVKTISRPSLLVDSGASAAFEAVQNIPIVSLVSEGGEEDRVATKIDYQAVGVRLNITPTVLSSGRVRLVLDSEYSDVENLSSSNQNPIFNTKSISSVVTISPGEVITLGGLISHDEDEQLGGVPLLRDLPLIGQAFSSTYRNNVKRELSIMLTVSVDEN